MNLAGPTSRPAGAASTRAGLPGFAWLLAGGPAVVVAAVLTGFAGRYGYHRDELYFLACGRHLAWGYPDQPPLVPLIARAMSALAPDSLVALRLPAALAMGALVLLTALIARELGAERRVQGLAAACMAVTPLVSGAGHLLSTTTFGLPAAAVICWLVARILRTGQDRLWLAAGLAGGIGLLDTDLIAFLLLAIAAGIAVAGPRRLLASPWMYTGGLIAAALWAPYLLWQASHGWPELAVARSIAGGGSGTSQPRWALLPFQLLLMSSVFAVWVAGLVRLLRGPGLRWCRCFGVALVVLVIAYTITGGKPYYLGGMAPVLLAAGAQPVADWVRHGRPRLRAGLVAAAVLFPLVSLPVTLPVVPVADLHATSVVALNYDAGETVGWPAFVAEIAAVYRALPAGQRADAVVLGSNYGEAGAVERFGPADGLPAAYGGQNGFWYWGPPPPGARTAIAIGFGRDQLGGFCGRLRLAARLNNNVGVQDDEQGAPVWVCSSLRQPWTAIWPKLRFFG